MSAIKSSKASRNAAREVLILCTTSKISSENKERLKSILTDGIDWEYLTSLTRLHGIIPLVAHNLSSNDLGDLLAQPYFDRLTQTYNTALYRNILYSNELTNILSTLSQHGIDVIPLKGTILAEILYENPALRSITDMDILVHPEDVPQARQVLNELGYEQLAMPPTWEHFFHEAPYHRRASIPFFLELHWDLEDRRLVTVPETEIWRRAQPYQVHGISTMVLSPEDNLLFLSTHLSKQGDELLKCLADIAELLKKYQDTLDWDYIVASTNSWQNRIPVYYALIRAKEILVAPVPFSVLEILHPRLWRRLLPDLLVSNKDFITPSSTEWLRDWTSVIARSLMLNSPRQSLIVLSRQQGSWKKVAWLRTAFWTTLVISAAFGRNVTRVFRK